MSLTTQYPCPACSYAYTKATGTTRARSGVDTRRRRQCLKCKAGFITYEISASDYSMMQTMRQWVRDNPVISCEPVGAH